MFRVWTRRRKATQDSIADVTRATGQRSVAVGGDIGLVVTGDNVTVNNPSPSVVAAAEQQSLASERQRLRMDMFRQALRHAEATFRLSVAFMSGGAAIILTGGILALSHAGNPDLSYMPLVTSLTGALITGGGGALAVHANRARKHVTEQGERLDVQIEKDHEVERLRGWIDRVVKAETRDQLNATAAIKDMGVDPDPTTVTNRVLPDAGGAAGEIESGPPHAGTAMP